MGLISRVSSRTYRRFKMSNQAFNQAKEVYLAAQKAFESGHLEVCGRALVELKLLLVQCTEFLPSGSQPSLREHVLTRDGLELGVLYSIAVKDINQFERYITQLKPYYQDFKNTAIPESKFTDQLLGLYLLYLLAKNQVGVLHAELEKISSEKIETSCYIQHPVNLEQCLMEGNYSKVFLAGT